MKNPDFHQLKRLTKLYRITMRDQQLV